MPASTAAQLFTLPLPELVEPPLNELLLELAGPLLVLPLEPPTEIVLGPTLPLDPPVGPRLLLLVPPPELVPPEAFPLELLLPLVLAELDTQTLWTLSQTSPSAVQSLSEVHRYW